MTTVGFCCPKCMEHDDIPVIEDGNSKSWGVSSVPLHVAARLNGMNWLCKSCSEPLLFSAQRKRINFDILTKEQVDELDK